MITKRISTWACALTLASVGYGQIDWHASPGGNNIVGSEWFGADGSSTVPLRIRHDANYPIDWYTDAIRRMLLRETATYTLGLFPGQVKDGSLLICPKVDNFTPAGPFSLLHLAASLSRVVPLALAADLPVYPA